MIATALILTFFMAKCLSIHLQEDIPAQEKTPLFGTSQGGKSFIWTSTLPNAEIREVSGRDGSYINQIKVRTQDKMEEETSPSFGGNGDTYIWKVPRGEYISGLEYRKGSELNGITFITNNGSRSPQFGGNGGDGPFTYNLPVGAKLNGFYGFKGSNIKGLGFIYKIHSTPEFGSNQMGSPFSWMSPLYNAEIRQISGKFSHYISQVKVKTTDRSKEETSPNFRDNGGEAYKWAVPNGQHIAKIEYKTGDWLNGIIFITNKGSRSPQFGVNSENEPETYVIPDGQRLAGIYGHKDAYIRGLGFYLAPIKERQTRKLAVYGNYNGGTKFEWVARNSSAHLSRVEGKEGENINKIKIEMTNGEASLFNGGYDGKAFNHLIPAGQHIVSATFKSGTWIDSVTFKTEKGKTFRIGGNGGNHVHTEEIPPGASIVGLYGSHNAYFLLSLGLIIAE